MKPDHGLMFKIISTCLKCPLLHLLFLGLSPPRWVRSLCTPSQPSAEPAAALLCPPWSSSLVLQLLSGLQGR